jgi:DNA-binding transcriptional ArsR family regulator
MAMQDGFEFVSKKKLNGESLNVMLFLMSKMDYENEVRVSHNEICEALTMQKQNVSRAMKVLKENGVLEEPEPRTIRLGIDVCWKGKVANLRKEQGQQLHASSRSKKSEKLEPEKLP